MKVLHLANWNSTNVGNGALIHGTERVLREDIPGIEFIPEAWDDYTFGLKAWDRMFVDRVNAHDALLVNGAVTFNAFRRANYNTGMRLDLPLPLWKEIRTPVILYGLSYRCWPLQDYPNHDACMAWIKYAVQSDTIFFGVRNDGTKEWLSDRFGIVSENIHEVPDPGMFVPHDDAEYPELHKTRKNVIIALNGEDALYRYATGVQKTLWPLARTVASQSLLERFVRTTEGYVSRRRAVAAELARAAEKIAQAHDVQFILVPHYLDDYVMIDEFTNSLDEHLAHQRTVSTGLVSVPYTKWFYGRYAKADIALSMRVHSMSPSLGLGTPVVPVTSQGRMRNFLNKIELSDIAVDVSDAHFAGDLATKANALLDDNISFKNLARNAVGMTRKRTAEINTVVGKILGY